jgi:DNA-nicking Smr family endonuclease
MDQVLVITGRGWGNRQQRPVLRPLVEDWLRGPDARRLGVAGFEPTHQGGALVVHLHNAGAHPIEAAGEDWPS